MTEPIEAELLDPEDEFEDDEDDPESDNFIPAIYLTDRTSAETDDKCGMRFWWYKKEAGSGIVPAQEALALKIGKETHEDLATIASLDDISKESIRELIDEITSSITTSDKEIQSVMEPLYRRLGWVAAFALFVEPRIRAEYETVQIEAEYILDRDPLWVAYTPDRLLRHRQGGYLVYREYKTTISASPKWMASWAFAPQIHIGLAGMQEELNEKIAFAQVMGLMKGDIRAGRLAHPYVWGYYNSKTDSWTHDYTKARSADWEHMPVWEYPHGVVDWVLNCGEETALAQFPHTAPVFLNNRLLTDWVNRRVAREKTIAEVEDLCQYDWSKRVIYFEPRTAQCRPAFGDPCPYLKCCWNAPTNENPLASGEFIKRTPHHEVELTFND